MYQFHDGIYLLKGDRDALAGRAAIAALEGRRLITAAFIAVQFADLRVGLDQFIHDDELKEELFRENEEEMREIASNPRYFKSDGHDRMIHGFVIPHPITLDEMVNETGIDVMKIDLFKCRTNIRDVLEKASELYRLAYYFLSEEGDPGKGMVAKRVYADPIVYHRLMIDHVARGNCSELAGLVQKFVEGGDPAYRVLAEQLRSDISRSAEVKDPGALVNAAWKKYLALKEERFEDAARQRDEIKRLKGISA